MNVWTFTGRLGADAELRTTQGGDKVLGFRVANDVGYGERKSTQWVDCSVWGRRAEGLAPHLKKGDLLVISGEVMIREYEKRDGSRGSGLSVRVSEVALTGGQRDDSGQGRGNGGAGNAYGGSAYGRTDGEGSRNHGGGGGVLHDEDLDDEIPFVTNGDFHRTGEHRPVI